MSDDKRKTTPQKSSSSSSKKDGSVNQPFVDLSTLNMADESDRYLDYLLNLEAHRELELPI